MVVCGGASTFVIPRDCGKHRLGGGLFAAGDNNWGQLGVLADDHDDCRSEGVDVDASAAVKCVWSLSRVSTLDECE